jgi:hypothetical protein
MNNVIKKGKGKLIPMSMHHAIKVCGGVEVKLHAF